jgi:hypothetical protein
MRRFSQQEISRMKQLWVAGFSLSTIAQVFDTDRETVWYRVKSDGKGNLADLAKALLPHLPTKGPPLPSGYSLTWVESRKLRQKREKEGMNNAEINFQRNQ